jgi:WD40 repeat protein
MRISLDSIATLPNDLDGVYSQEFDSFDNAQLLLSLAVVIPRNPLPEGIFKRALCELGLCDDHDDDEHDYYQLRRKLSSSTFVRFDEVGAVRTQHKSAKDWMKKKVTIFNEGEIHQCLANVMEIVYQTIKSECSLSPKAYAKLNPAQVYAIEESAYHLLRVEILQSNKREGSINEEESLEGASNLYSSSPQETTNSPSRTKKRFHRMTHKSRCPAISVKCETWFEDFDRIFWLSVNASAYGISGFQRIFNDPDVLNSSNAKSSVQYCLDLLKLSTKALLFDPRELAGQIIGRTHSKTYNPADRLQLRQGAENWLQFSKANYLVVARPLLNFSGLKQASGVLKSTLIHPNSVMAVACSPVDSIVCTGCDDCVLRFFNLSGEVLREVEAHSSTILSIAFSSDGRLIVTGSEDETAKVWDVESGELRITLVEEHTEGIMSVAYLNGKTIVTGCHDGKVSIWDVESGECKRTLEGHSDAVSTVACSNDGELIFTGATDFAAKIWDTETGKCKGRLNESSLRFVTCAAFSSDAKKIVTGSTDLTAKIHHNSGEYQQSFQGHAESVDSVAFSSDGKSIVTGSQDCTTKIWNVKSGKCQLTLEGHTDGVTSIAISADGTSIVTGSMDCTARIWNVESRLCKKTTESEGNSQIVSSVAYSSDGKSIVTVGQDRSVMVWDVGSEQCLKFLEGHSSEVTSVAYSSDGRYIITKDDVATHYWDSTTFEKVTNIDRQIALNLPVPEELEVFRDHVQVPIHDCVSFTMDDRCDEGTECYVFRHANSKYFDAHAFCGEAVMIWRFS